MEKSAHPGLRQPRDFPELEATQIAAGKSEPKLAARVLGVAPAGKH
jgi:hypothetical protein